MRPLHLLSVGVEFRGHALGDADQSRKDALQGLESLVGHTFNDHGFAVIAQVQLPHVTDVGQAHEFRDLRADLTGFAVSAVAAADDKVGFFPLQREGQRPGGSQRVGPGQGAVGDQHRTVGPQRNTVGQPLAGARRAHGDDYHLVFRGPLQLHGPDQAKKVKGINLGWDSVTDDGLGFVVELDTCDDGHVFHANGGLH